MLAKSPVFTLVAVLSLALGIGANTAIFSLMDVVMLRSLPVDEPGQLVLFGDGRSGGSTDSLPNESWTLFSYPFYRTFSQQNEVFSSVTAIKSIEFATHGALAGAGPEMLHASLVSGTYFSVLGVNPDRGRTLTEADDQTPDSGAVAVASYSWWQRHGNDPAAVGKAVAIEGTNYTIVGVAPKGFIGTMVGESPDFWIQKVVSIALSGGPAQARRNSSSGVSQYKPAVQAVHPQRISRPISLAEGSGRCLTCAYRFDFRLTRNVAAAPAVQPSAGNPVYHRGTCSAHRLRQPRQPAPCGRHRSLA
jgi:hypothetical protein